MRVSVADFCYKIVSSTQCRHGPHRAPHTPPTTWTESSACCVNMKGLKGWVRTWSAIATRARLACRCRQPNVEPLSPRNGTSSWRHGASLAGSHGRIVYSTRMDPLVGVTDETFRVLAEYRSDRDRHVLLLVFVEFVEIARDASLTVTYKGCVCPEGTRAEHGPKNST